MRCLVNRNFTREHWQICRLLCFVEFGEEGASFRDLLFALLGPQILPNEYESAVLYLIFIPCLFCTYRYVHDARALWYGIPEGTSTLFTIYYHLLRFTFYHLLFYLLLHAILRFTIYHLLFTTYLFTSLPFTFYYLPLPIHFYLYYFLSFTTSNSIFPILVLLFTISNLLLLLSFTIFNLILLFTVLVLQFITSKLLLNFVYFLPPPF